MKYKLHISKKNLRALRNTLYIMRIAIVSESKVPTSYDTVEVIICISERWIEIFQLTRVYTKLTKFEKVGE